MYDVAVIGLGAFGSHTLWQLAERGVKAVGLDQYPVVHPFGSSHGHTRLFRIACMEHIELGTVARRAAELWRGLEDHSGTPILNQVGAVTIGRPDSDYVKGAIATAAHHEVPIETYSADELVSRFPAFENIDPDEIGVLDTSGGTVGAEASIASALGRARELGADVLGGGRVESIRRTAGSTFELGLSTGNTVRAKKIVLALGPWLANAVDIPGLQALFSPMNWWRIDEELAAARARDIPGYRQRSAEAYLAPQLPGFIRRFDDMSIWGHGDVDGHGMKIGLSLNSKELHPIDPANFDRDIEPTRDWRNVARVARRAFPTLDPVPAASRVCMITTSPDDQFTIGQVGRDTGVYVAGTCHGHGFKHAAAIGEYLAQTVLGEARTVEPGIWDAERLPGFTDQLLETVFEKGSVFDPAGTRNLAGAPAGRDGTR
ncbi:FAD-dependent oxidoreductase [Brevibacterium sp. 91QC2O2]|uniref:FAD-dependent oxidoreductase n=1 Tax=Brevibacterium sp. 91QC2O2 TaxID=2968458 RepID=UPI00211CA151|nr:FAD-dependent oxidoreductase [Brevibacterium sp. 91QC2O2]MCQ9369437.1 FAD-dependent oxidoreductase [Brevibacterium sp. 91QC2O2]